MIGFIIVGLLILITVGVFIFSYKKETDEIRKKELKEENFEALDLNTRILLRTEQNTRTTMFWAKFWSILSLIGMVIWFIIIMIIFFNINNH